MRIRIGDILIVLAVVAVSVLLLVLPSRETADSLTAVIIVDNVEYERIDCDDSYPSNGMCFDYSWDGGSHWSGGLSGRELFHYIYGRRIEMRLTEVSQARVDTLGVAYTLTLTEGEEREDRAGFIAMQNL